MCWIQWRVVLEVASLDHFAFLLVAWVERYCHIDALLHLLCAGTRANLSSRAYSFVAHVPDSQSTTAVVEGLFRGFRIYLGGRKLVSSTAVGFAALEYLLGNQEEHLEELERVRAVAARSAATAAFGGSSHTQSVPTPFHGPPSASSALAASPTSLLVTSKSFSRGGGGQAAYERSSAHTADKQPDATPAFLKSVEGSGGCFQQLLNAASTCARPLSKGDFQLGTVVALVEQGFSFSAAAPKVSTRITRSSSRSPQDPGALSPSLPSASPSASGIFLGADAILTAPTAAVASPTTPASAPSKRTLRELLLVAPQPPPPTSTLSPAVQVHSSAAAAVSPTADGTPSCGLPLGPWGTPSPQPFYVRGKLGNKESFLLRTSLRPGGSGEFLPPINLDKVLELSALEVVQRKVPRGHVWGKRAFFSSSKVVGRRKKGLHFTRSLKLRAATLLAAGQ